MRPRALVPILLIGSWLVAGSGGRAAAQADGVAAVLADLQNALQSRRLADFVKRSAPALATDDVGALEKLTERDVKAISIRERARDGNVVLAEALISYGSSARLSNWLIGIAPGSASGRPALTSLREVSAFDELIRLDLETTEQFLVRNLTLRSGDFELTMSSGTAFRAYAPAGITGMVLRGRGRVRFSPADATEQGQLRIFAGRTDLATDVDEAFIRLNPSDHDRLLSIGSLQPVSPERSDVRRARDIFDTRALYSYQFSLGDLSSERWSIQPPVGGMLVDFRSSRFGWLSYASTPDEPEDVSLFDRARNRQISLYMSPDHRARFGASYNDDIDAVFDVTHTALDLDFDPARRWFSGRAELRVTMRRAMSAIKLRLADSLIVSSVSSPELGPLLALRAAGLNTMVIGLPGETNPGQELSLEVQYHGRLDPQALDREALALEQESPERQIQEPVIAFPIEPRFLYSTRHAWYPQTGSSRHATATVRLTVPAEYHAVATGRLIATSLSESSSDQSSGRGRPVKIVEYRADQPVRYLAFLATRLVAAGRARSSVPAVSADSGEGVDIDVMTSPGLTGRRRVTPEGVAAMVSFYAKLLGGAPYPSLTVAVLEDTLPGGHSPAGFAMINQPHPATPYSWASDPVSFSDAPAFFLAHEVAHQWWGQAIGARNYHEQWISEGFAQYFAWLYVESVEGASTGRRLMARMRETAAEYTNEGPIHLGSRIGHLRANSRPFRAIVYNKSAAVLHMLRRLIGDEAFFDGLRQLYRDGRFKRIGTDDVERAFQAQTAIPLAMFFRKWILEAVVPAVRVSTLTSAGASRVRVDQVGDVLTFPLDIDVNYTDGTEERVTVKMTERAHEFQPSGHRVVRQALVVDDLSIVRVVR